MYFDAERTAIGSGYRESITCRPLTTRHLQALKSFYIIYAKNP